MKGYIINICTKYLLLEVFHATVHNFAPYLARSKNSRGNANVIMKITDTNVGVKNTSETFWPIGQEYVNEGGDITFETSRLFNKIC